ncbi:YkuS family protein [Serpentinicella alkaliphila]|uniref:Uncharacterized protein UPF0180 n=1 Tax=Serpentinicella alkaliphila TaxID=1734049 RepID=A0A4R2TIS2_9FIRM|nr:YkuS family protein [Serpentinicella alkaliphila]QUH25158.1 YkuS family protein [Serpentinicella alkaliphila]TCQ02247.1 uncharacterized protein UPF0180 [Serpentinicella alkaliphila]
MKRVALQEGLKDIKNELEERGYEVVDFNDSRHVDAVIYLNNSNGFMNINNTQGDNSGAVIINARNRSIDDLVYIIETRRYERLF